MDTKLVEWLISNGFSESLAILTKTFIFGAGLLILSYLAFVITKKVITEIINRALLKSSFRWDDAFVENKVFVKLAHLVPAIIVLAFINTVFRDYDKWIPIVTKASYFYIIITVIVIINSIILSFYSIYNMYPLAKTRHIKGYVQLVQIIVVFIGIMMLISILFDQKLSGLFLGLGTFAAVLMLVFKDTILGFVASIQVSMNKMVNPGDWISMPGRNADGVVLEINLNTVKVQNWDKTISTIPTYALVSESFQNWKDRKSVV